MKHLIILLLVSAFLFALGQALFNQRQAASSDEALALSSDMNRGEQEQYLLEQARRLFRQGKYSDVFEIAVYARERLGSESAAMAELYVKSRDQLEESALGEAEKVQRRVREMADLPRQE